MITQAPRHSGSRYIAADADDPAAFGPDGLLRDGFKIRVPVELMDAKLPLQRVATVPRNIVTGLTGKDSLDRYFFPDGTEKPARTPRTERHLPAADVDRYGANKPGFRTADAITVDDGEAIKNAAYNEMCHDLQDAWKTPEQRTADARQVTDAACPAGVDPRDFAYRQMCTDLQDAWKAPAAFDAAAVQDLPAGRYPLSAGIGSICDLNGEQGTLQPDGAGYLVCKVTRHVGPTRADAVPPRTMSAADGQALKSAAWNEMVADLSSAWRSPA
jgi:hypothetical protein